MRIERGFTLIELLVVMGVFLAVSAVVGGILFSTLRGSQKTTTLDEVRQNGNYAISTMTKSIRAAKSIDSPTNCTAPTPTPVQQIMFTPQTGSQTTFKCDYASIPKTITSNNNSLLDTTKVALVEGSCSFTCTQVSGQPPTIKIKFGLSQVGTTIFTEQTAAVDFETSVTLRNP